MELSPLQGSIVANNYKTIIIPHHLQLMKSARRTFSWTSRRSTISLQLISNSVDR